MYKWINSFREAWEMLVDIPLPKFLAAESDDEEDQQELLACFPVVGAVVGLGLFCIAWAISILLSTHTAAALVGSIFLALISESIASSSNIAGLAAFCRAKQEKASTVEIVDALESANSDISENQIFFISLYLLKIFCFALIVFYERTSWLIIVYTMSYLLRSQMVTWNELRTSQALIDVENETSAIRLPWIVAMVIALFVAGFDFFPAVIIVAIITYLLIRYFKRMVDNDFNGITGSLVGTAGAVTELILLILGIVLLARP